MPSKKTYTIKPQPTVLHKEYQSRVQ